MLLKIKGLIGDEELKERGRASDCAYASENAKVLFTTWQLARPTNKRAAGENDLEAA